MMSQGQRRKGKLGSQVLKCYAAHFDNADDDKVRDLRYPEALLYAFVFMRMPGRPKVDPTVVFRSWSLAYQLYD